MKYLRRECDGAVAVKSVLWLTALAAGVTLTVSALAAAESSGQVVISGEMRQWHKVTLTVDGPFARETDPDPNPFTDFRLRVTFRHVSGQPEYRVPGYFAADGRAGESSATEGSKWRAHLSPDKPGRWNYEIQFVQGKHVAVDPEQGGQAVPPINGKSGHFEIRPTDKQGRDFRYHGRLQYVGKRYLRFAGSGEYFLKAGPDAPETMLAYRDFDGTSTRKVPLKSWEPHRADWREGDPTWQGGKGKGLIGAVNYLADAGCNAFSFLTYNAGGDGDNVWPFVDPDDPLHYDCSKLDQWQIVFDHAQSRGLYLHFKMQEQENDDNRHGQNEVSEIPAALDDGDLEVARKLYCRELISRFGHSLALNWNLGEENTQSAEQQRAMAGYLRETDPYDHHIVVHTFPNAQDRVYRQLLGNQSVLTGVSLQNPWHAVHARTLHWIRAAEQAGKPWVVANDEQNPAVLGVPPDPGYQGFDGVADDEGRRYDLHDIRKFTLWGNLMAGGAGVEYYFGYRLPANDLLCEDFRSRDQSWVYCRRALDFFRDEQIPFETMQNMNALVGNKSDSNERYCFAKPDTVYLIYLPDGGVVTLDLAGASGDFSVAWLNPRSPGPLRTGAVDRVSAGTVVELGPPPADAKQDWLIVVRR